MNKTTHGYPLSRAFLSAAGIVMSSCEHSAVTRPGRALHSGCCCPDLGSDAGDLPTVDSAPSLRCRHGERTCAVLHDRGNIVECGRLRGDSGVPGACGPHDARHLAGSVGRA